MFDRDTLSLKAGLENSLEDGEVIWLVALKAAMISGCTVDTISIKEKNECFREN